MHTSPQDRFTKRHPCPACGGGHDMGDSERCWGFLARDGKTAMCTQLAGSLQGATSKAGDTLYPHALSGRCKCGEPHAAGSAPAEPARQRKARAIGERPHPADEGWTFRAPVPAHAPPVPWERPGSRMTVEAAWPWPDSQGRTLFYTARRLMGGERNGKPRKAVTPWTCWERADGSLAWENVGPPDGWTPPLLNLPELLARLEAPVLIVAGEKKVAPAATRFPEYVVTTWHGGENRPGVGDWSTLAGRQVDYWPDADDTGRECADQVARLLTTAGVARVRVVDVPESFGAHRKGWDLADELPPGVDDEAIADLLAAAPEWASDTQAEPDDRGGDEVEEPASFVIQRRAEILARPPITWLAEGWIAAGALVMLYGPSNCGKSLVAWDLANRYEHGLPWGGDDLAQGRALYVYGEGGEGLRSRLEAWEQVHGIDAMVAAVDVEDGQLQLHEPGTVARFIARLAALPAAERPSLIILDTQATMTVGANENASEQMTIVLQSLKRMRRALGATIVVVHHADKTGAGARGSSSLFAGYSTVLRADEDGPGRVRLRIEKMKDGRKGLEKRWELVTPEGCASVALRPAVDSGEASQPSRAKLKDVDVLILRAIEASWEGLTNQEIADNLGLTKQRTSDRMPHLRASGHVRFDERTRRYKVGQDVGGQQSGCPGADSGAQSDCPPCPGVVGQGAPDAGQQLDMGLSGMSSVSTPLKGGDRRTTSGPVGVSQIDLGARVRRLGQLGHRFGSPGIVGMSPVLSAIRVVGDL